MKPLNKTLVIMIVLLIAVGVGYFVSWKRNTNDNSSIKIGAPLILTGEGATWGENAKHGIELALDEINAEGGINNRRVEIVFGDTGFGAAGAGAKNAVLLYHKMMTQDHVDALIGFLTETELQSVAPLISKDGVPSVAVSYTAPQNRPNPFNPMPIWMDPSTEAYRLADYVYDQGARTASAIGTEDSWEKEVTEAFAERFAKRGGEITFQELVQPHDPDVRTTITKALSKNPDAVFVGTFFQFIPLVKGMHENSYRGKVYSAEVDAYLASQTRAYSNGLQFIAPDLYTDAFNQEFQVKYGAKPGLPAGQAYDAMKILASLIDGTKNKSEIIQHMKALKSYRGASGEITFTPDGKTLLPTAIFELQDGNAVRRQPQ